MKHNQLIQDSHDNPNVWYAGYDASNSGEDAASCPYTPRNVRMMNVWLSGHVTATDERTK